MGDSTGTLCVHLQRVLFPWRGRVYGLKNGREPRRMRADKDNDSASRVVGGDGLGRVYRRRDSGYDTA